MTRFKSKILLIMILMPLAFASFSFAKSPGNGYVSVDNQINRLLAMHRKYLNDLFVSSGNEMDNFDKYFFTDFSFMNDPSTKNFFRTLQYDLESGKLPGPDGAVMISYSNYVSINGKTTGVTYNYTSDGNKIILVKGTYNNGSMVRAVYNYDVHGKRLNAREYIGKKLFNNNTHKIDI